MYKQIIFAESAKKYNRFIIQKNMSDDTNCPICIDSMLNRSVIHTPCKHVFHLFCLLTLFNSDGINIFKCPLCRHNFMYAIMSLYD